MGTEEEGVRIEEEGVGMEEGVRMEEEGVGMKEEEGWRR